MNSPQEGSVNEGIEVRKALKCLALEVDKTIVGDVTEKFNNYAYAKDSKIEHLEAEIQRLKEKNEYPLLKINPEEIARATYIQSLENKLQRQKERVERLIETLRLISIASKDTGQSAIQRFADAALQSSGKDSR